MIDEARRLTPPELAARVRFEVGGRVGAAVRATARSTSSRSLNMIPFFDELARVTRAGRRGR